MSQACLVKSKVLTRGMGPNKGEALTGFYLVIHSRVPSPCPTKGELKKTKNNHPLPLLSIGSQDGCVGDWLSGSLQGRAMVGQQRTQPPAFLQKLKQGGEGAKRRHFSIATVLQTHTGALREYNKA